jgi:hypothetical protein
MDPRARIVCLQAAPQLSVEVGGETITASTEVLTEVYIVLVNSLTVTTHSCVGVQEDADAWNVCDAGKALGGTSRYIEVDGLMLGRLYADTVFKMGRSKICTLGMSSRIITAGSLCPPQLHPSNLTPTPNLHLVGAVLTYQHPLFC